MESYDSFENIFSYEKIKIKNNGEREYFSGHFLMAIMGSPNWHSSYTPEKVIFKICKLKIDLLHFKKGTMFDEIELNEHCTLKFSIFDDNNEHLFEKAGYHYKAYLDFLLEHDGKTFPSSGTWDFFFHAKPIFYGLLNMKFENCAVNKDMNFSEETLDWFTINLLKGTWHAPHHNGKMQVKIRFDLCDIPVPFLKLAFNKNLITENEYKSSKDQRDLIMFPKKLELNSPQVQKKRNLSSENKPKRQKLRK